ncbi:900_t:CDS:2, partial [Funneliformis caledonium]
TSEEFRPTLQFNQVNAELAPKSVGDTGFKQFLDTYDYSCDASLFPDDHYLIEVLFVRVKISCDTPVEILYYFSQKSGNYDICYYCGIENDLISLPSILTDKFKIIYPLCQGCQDRGKKFNTRLEVKVNNSKRRKVG